MRPLNINWKSTPGNFDPNHLKIVLESDNDWGLPNVAGVAVPIDVDWAMAFDSYRTKVRGKRTLPDGLGVIHFFTEDYRFEQLWTSPDRFLGYMTPENWALTPDFSLYTDHPPAVHLWNLFRSRWLGAFWQCEQLRVIPTVSWAGSSSYGYCFAGLPSKSVLAVSTVGVLRRRDAVKLWKAGFEEMVARLDPVQVLCYGALPKGFTTPVPVKHLQTFQTRFAEVADGR